MTASPPSAYVAALIAGPFPNGIDPWAEDDHYFHALHEQMIGAIVSQISQPLVERGYFVSREVSLQIGDLDPAHRRREPDIQIRRGAGEPSPASTGWNYAEAAAALGLNPGVTLEAASEPVLDGILIHEKAGRLVTVVEIISPRNKIGAERTLYQQRRDHLVQQEGINIVEIDLTRSSQRMTPSAVTSNHPYHAAIHLPGWPPTALTSDLFDRPLQSIALPLRGEALPVALHRAYQQAYRETTTAVHLREDGFYTRDHLPSPSTLDGQQIETALRFVREWEHEIEQTRLIR